MDGINRSSLFEAAVGDLDSIRNKFDYFDLGSSSTEDSVTSSDIPLINGTTSSPSTRDEFLAKIEQSILAVIFVLTLTGNFLVLMGIYLRKQKMTRMYYFIIHLAIADLVTAFFQVLTQLAWEITYRFQGGQFMCKFVKYAQILGPYSSSYILVMTAIDRYQAICFPLSNCSWTARRSKMMLSFAWILSFLCCLPQLYIFSYQEIKPNSGEYDCWGEFEPHWGEKAYITWYCISVFIIPLIILIFAYTCITHVIWQNFSQKNAIIQEQRVSKSLVREDSDDVEHEFDQSIEENEKRVFHENHKNSNKSFNERKLFGAAGSKPKNLEVSWRGGKSGSITTTSTNELSSSSAYNKCQPHCNSSDLDLINESVEPQYFSEEASYLSSLNPTFHDGTTSSGNHSQGDTGMNYGENKSNSPSHQVSADRLLNSKGATKSMGSEKRQSWKSVSMSSEKDNKSSSKDLNGTAHEKGKGQSRSLLTPIEKGHQRVVQRMSRSISVRSSTLNSVSQPRTHSVKGISRAKIKTVKLTVTVISVYIICSSPFIAALMWSAYDPYAKEHPFFYGPTFAILTLLASLNSCANAWIVLFFNPNLLQSFARGTCGRFCRFGQHSTPSSFNASQRKQMFNNKKFPGSGNQRPANTSVTGLSPLMSRLSPKEYELNRSTQEGMELIPPMASKDFNITSGESSLSSRNRYPQDKAGDETPIETSFMGN